MSYVREGDIDLMDGDDPQTEYAWWARCPVCDELVTAQWLDAAGGCSAHRRVCYCEDVPDISGGQRHQCGAAVHVSAEEFHARLFKHPYDPAQLAAERKAWQQQ